MITMSMLETSYCICTTEKTKTKVQMRGKFSHNLRLHDVKNADPERRHLNKVLYGEDNIKNIFQMSMEEASENHKRHKYKTYVDQAEEDKWMVEHATGRKVRKDAVLQIELVLTYTKKDMDVMTEEEWCKANIEWLKDYFGEENLISAILHKDESGDIKTKIVTDEKTGKPIIDEKTGKPKKEIVSVSGAHIHVMISPIDRESGSPKFNAKKWLGGRKAMIELQNSYAKAMEPFGLRRGEENSRASHQDLQTFYRALNNVVRQKLPQREQFKDEQSYQEAIDTIYNEAVVRMFALEKAIERLEAVDKTREGNNRMYREITEAQIKDYEEQMAVLRSDLSAAEKKAKFVDNMQTALKDIEQDDPDRADKIRENLNNLSRKGGALERALQRKKAAQNAAQDSMQDTEQNTDIEL